MALIIYIKRFLKSPSFIAALLFMPLTAAILMLCIKTAPTDIRVGIAGSGTNTDTVKSILLDSDGSVSFIDYADEDMLISDIISGQLECGYVFDIEKSFKNDSFKRSITCLRSSSTVFDKIINELVTEAITEVYCKIKAQEKSHELSLNTDIGAVYDSFMQSDDIFRANFVMIDNKSPDGIKKEPDDTYAVQMLFRCIFAVYVLLSALLGAAAVIGDRKKGILKRNYVCIFSSALIMTIAAEITYTLLFGFDIINPLAAILYCFAVCGFSYIIICFGSRNFVLGTLPVLVTGSFVFCPALFDVGSIIPAFKAAGCVFPPVWYFSIYGNGIATLAIVCAAVNAIGYALNRLILNR